MASFILIHGSWHGGWCWDSIVKLLEAAGHTAHAPDLPGMGDDNTPFADDTLAQWADFTANQIRVANEPVILVGHSRGGLVISEAAERVPEGISKLVYVTAFLLEAGDSLMSFAARFPGEGPADALIPSADGKTLTLDKDKCRPILYSQSSDVDFDAAAERFCPEPFDCWSRPLILTAENFGRVPRVYIEATADRTITPEMQRTMYENLSCETVIKINADHMPQYSDPKELCNALLSLC